MIEELKKLIEELKQLKEDRLVFFTTAELAEFHGTTGQKLDRNVFLGKSVKVR